MGTERHCSWIGLLRQLRVQGSKRRDEGALQLVPVYDAMHTTWRDNTFYAITVAKGDQGFVFLRLYSLAEVERATDKWKAHRRIHGALQ